MPWESLQAFLLSAEFYTICMSYRLDPGQARRFVGPDLGPFCLQKSNQHATLGEKDLMRHTVR